MPPPSSLSGTLDGLPKPFVGALRTLFDIMDDKGAGFVKFSEIERRWQDDGTKGLPKGVIESLRKVTPPNGLLSFERFCAGLKICLLRNQRGGLGAGVGEQPARPPSAPLLDVEKPHWPASNTATVRPNNAMPQQRTLSMPQLPGESSSGGAKGAAGPPVQPQSYAPLGPPKPPRTAAGLERAMQLAAQERGVDKQEIRAALQNWQMGLIMGQPPQQTDDEEEEGGPGGEAPLASWYGKRSKPLPARGGSGAGGGLGDTQMYKKTNGRRREPRRHTLQNGIDYNMLKRMKQMEMEKEVLVQGLQAVERARDWYLKQIANVTDKIGCLGRPGAHVDQWSEAHHERLQLQRARVLEVNRHLALLTDGGDRGGPPPLAHMNLALPHPPSLRHQNRLLTADVGKKAERIAVLEREKAALMRELYQTRRRGADLDNAFM